MIRGPFEVTLPGICYCWWLTALGNLLIVPEGPQASHRLHSQEAEWGPAGPHRACAPCPNPTAWGLGKPGKWGPLWGEHLFQGVGALASVTSIRASVSDSTSRVKIISWKSSERCIFHDHLSAVGVKSALSLHLRSQQNWPLFLQTQRCWLGPALGRSVGCCAPWLLKEKITFYITLASYSPVKRVIRAIFSDGR